MHTRCAIKKKLIVHFELMDENVFCGKHHNLREKQKSKKAIKLV